MVAYNLSIFVALFLLMVVLDSMSTTLTAVDLSLLSYEKPGNAVISIPVSSDLKNRGIEVLFPAIISRKNYVDIYTSQIPLNNLDRRRKW